MTFREYRLEAKLSLAELARRAGVDYGTAKRAEDGYPVQEVKAVLLVEALSDALGRTVKVQDIDDLRIFQP